MTEINNVSSSGSFEVLAFFAADHAAVENSKVYVNGGFFDRIYQPAYPAQISIAMVAVLEVSPEAFLQDHKFAIEMTDQQGNTLPTPVRIEGGFRVAPTPDLRPGDPTKLPLAVSLDGLTIERAGNYLFVLKVDGNELDRYEIRAAQVGLVSQPFTQVPGGDGGAPEEQ
jgi:hypothetical protein